MKTEIIKSTKRKGNIMMPKQVVMTAQNKDDEEILNFIVEMNHHGGLNPTIDKIVEMISSGELKRVGDKWSVQVGTVINNSQSHTPMFG